MKKISKQEYTAEFKEQAVSHAQAVGIVVATKDWASSSRRCAALPPAMKEELHDRFDLAHTAAGYALYGLFALHLAGALTGKPTGPVLYIGRSVKMI